MLFKGFGLGLFVVLAAILMLGTFAADYKTFKRQHHVDPNSIEAKSDCTKLMQKRKMTSPDCKWVNTFIYDTIDNIKDVCGNGGQAYKNIFRRSRNQFQITTCRVKGSNKPPCIYTGTPLTSSYIVIACKNGKPVHYEI